MKAVIRLHDVERDTLVRAIEDYIRQDGIGNYSHWRAADYIMENKPGLARALIERFVIAATPRD